MHAAADQAGAYASKGSWTRGGSVIITYLELQITAIGAHSEHRDAGLPNAKRTAFFARTRLLQRSACTQ
jgi:hypothetical protein